MKAFYFTEILFVIILTEKKSIYLFPVYFNDALWYIIEQYDDWRMKADVK